MTTAQGCRLEGVVHRAHHGWLVSRRPGWAWGTKPAEEARNGFSAPLCLCGLRVLPVTAWVCAREREPCNLRPWFLRWP